MAPISRRALLRTVAASTATLPLIGSAEVLAHALFQADALGEARKNIGVAPIVATPLSDTLTFLSGPGGNVLVLSGSDGKLVVDTFVQPAWVSLKQRLDAMSNAPIRLLIDTHWHFDHTDNNEHFRKAGAAVLAHVNTKKRMSQTHELLGMRFPPSPASALPTQTFMDLHRLKFSGEQVEAGRIPPAHTDTDIYIRFGRANVLHLGDVYFNGVYPFIDASTGGNINGQIAGATLGLKLSDNSTRIIPGHGPIADKAALTQYRDMMVTVRDRVEKLKASGRSVQDVVAAKPTAELDATWGKGFIQPNDFVATVYNTLRLK
jgi:glyoxylase-like metal-dependent hydrolase (beta-lactamase superfamily II)